MDADEERPGSFASLLPDVPLNKWLGVINQGVRNTEFLLYVKTLYTLKYTGTNQMAYHMGCILLNGIGSLVLPDLYHLTIWVVGVMVLVHEWAFRFC